MLTQKPRVYSDRAGAIRGYDPVAYSHGVRERWKKEVPGYLRKGDANWPTVLQR